jgi:hypothetical protein
VDLKEGTGDDLHREEEERPLWLLGYLIVVLFLRVDLDLV